jgi:hypothetical protein
MDGFDGPSLFILPDLPMDRSVQELQRYMALAVKVWLASVSAS